jgi:hypothetical protein
MLVKAIREHQNFYGDKPLKAVGAKYEIGSESTAKALIRAGLVEEAKAESKAK